MEAMENPTSPLPESWREKITRQYIQLKGIAYEAMMLDKIMRQNAIARDIAVRSANGTLGKAPENNMPDEDDMGIRIGDEIHHHHHAAPPAPVAQPSPIAPSTTQPAPPATTEAATGKLSPWITSAAVIAASALGGGVAVPIGGAVIDWMTSNDPPAVTQPVETIEPQPTPALPPGIDSGGVRIEPFKVGE